MQPLSLSADLVTLVEELRASCPDTRRRALAAVLLLPSEEWVEELAVAVAAQLAAENELLRGLAAYALAKGGALSLSVLPALFAALADESDAVRDHVLQALQRVPLGEVHRARLVGMLADDSCLVRISAAEVIWKHYRDADAVRPVLAAALASEDKHATCLACHLLTDMPEERPAFRAALERLVREQPGAVRASALYTLSRFLTDREELLALCDACDGDEEPAVRLRVKRIRAGKP
jgi:HEAT repeat protein